MKVTDDILDLDMMSKFLNGPEIVHTPDDLFEWFESKGRPNLHYFVVYNNIKFRFPKTFSPSVKLFRNFYIQNSQYFGENVKFVEIHNMHTASFWGISGDDEGVLHHFMHKSDNIDIEGDEIKVFNIDMIVHKNESQSENNSDSYTITNNELYSDRIQNKSFADFIKHCLISVTNIFYTCSRPLLSFYLSYFTNMSIPFTLILIDRKLMLSHIQSPELYHMKLLQFLK